MKRSTFLVSSSLALLLSVAAIGIGAAVDTPRTLMSPADYSSAKRAIDAEARVALGRCREVDGAARDVCKAEVRAQERIKKADLQARYHGTVAAADDARQARVKALYDVAKARCGSHAGDDRLQCLRSARDDRDRSLSTGRLASAT